MVGMQKTTSYGRSPDHVIVPHKMSRQWSRG